MAYADYIYRRCESGIYYFRYAGELGTTRFSLKTRNYRDAKRKAALHFTELMRYEREMSMGDYDKLYLGDSGGPWMLPDEEKIKYVLENLAAQIPEDKADDNAFLIKMFDIYTEKKRSVDKEKINKMASEFYGKSVQMIQTVGLPVESNQSDLTLSQLIEEFIELKEDKWKGAHLEQAEARLGLICELLGGDSKVRALKRKDFSNLIKNLQRLPARRTKAIYKNLNLAHLLTLNLPKGERFSITTFNAILDRLSQLFRYAYNAGHVERNLTCELKGEVSVGDVKHELEKVPYSMEELQLIVDLSWKKEKRDDRRWIPLIAMFSGMRQSEICQLRCEDVFEEEGVWFIRITDEGVNMSVKTKAGHRRVPIHSKLLNLGFLSYVSSVYGENLWPKLKADKRGRKSGAIQKWFCRINDAITDDPAKTFHSMRKNVVTSIMNSGIERHLYQKVIGHGDGSTTAKYEGKIAPELAKNIIEKIVYEPALNFNL